MIAEGLATYEEAIDWLHGLLRFGQKPGLERMQWMLEQVGHPERRLAFIHVAGTNGKGSTCSYLSQMLIEAGYSVGMFTSPYLIDFRERIRYNGAMIPEADLVELIREAKHLAERCEAESGHGSPTEFEVITLIAILYFANVTRPAVVIWETGLGGRLDSTNVVLPIATVITNVGMDHMDVLGNSLIDIAREKAGIIKPGVPVITGERRAEVLAVLQEAADKSRSTLYRIGSQFDVEQLQESVGEQTIRYRSLLRREEAEYRLAMNGPHQAVNAAVSLMTIDILRNFLSYLLEEEEIARGLQQTRWPGRLEVVSPRPMVMLDGAHNQEGIEALVTSLQRLTPPEARLHVLFSGLADKPLASMAEALRGLQTKVETVRLTTFDFPRAATAGHLQEAFLAGGWESARLELISDWRQFLASWVKDNRTANGDDWLVVCGSLYFIAQVRTFFPTTVEEVGE